MKIKNHGSEFTINFDNEEYVIKSGVSEVSSVFGSYVLYKATRWGKNVEEIDPQKVSKQEEMVREAEETVKNISEEIKTLEEKKNAKSKKAAK